MKVKLLLNTKFLSIFIQTTLSMQNGLTKTEHNKRNYSLNKPYPVRLGIIKEIAMECAFENEYSLHYVLVRKLEEVFWPQILIKAAVAASKYGEVLRLVKKEYTLKEACVHLSVHEKLFIIGISDEQAKELIKLIPKQEVDNLELKRGHYKQVLIG